MSGESDLAQLGKVRDDLRDKFQRLKDDRETGLARETSISQAKERLSVVQSNYHGPTVEDAEQAVATVIEKGRKAKSRMEKLERELEKARDAVESLKTEYHAADTTLNAAHSHAAAIKQLTDIASQPVSCPDESEVTLAKEAVNEATVAYGMGIRIRDMAQNHEKAKAHRESEKSAMKAAEEARNRAGQVFGIFSRSLHMTHLQIKTVDGAPRLFVQHPNRGQTAFDQVNGLSDGERVDYTLRELLPHIESPGLLPIPQRVWQDLQPTDRKNLHALAVEKGLYLFGAQVDDGELRVAFIGSQDD